MTLNMEVREMLSSMVNLVFSPVAKIFKTNWNFDNHTIVFTVHLSNMEIMMVSAADKPAHAVLL
jgi:hypothetical protein